MSKCMKLMLVVFLPVLLLPFLLAGCGELGTEEAIVPLVNLLPGSPGYEGDGTIHGLLNGSYLIKHQKKETTQKMDPAGRMQIYHEEDYYALDGNGALVKIASSNAAIPSAVANTPLSGGLDISFPVSTSDEFHAGYYDNRYFLYAINTITGLVNGETYGVYRYGELNSGQRIGRIQGHLQTHNVNTIVNIRNLQTGGTIDMIDRRATDPANQSSGIFNANNHLVVLIGTGLYWTEIPQVLSEDSSVNAVLRIIGNDFDIVIEKITARGWVSVDAIKEDGQSYFVLTGSPDFRGRIVLAGKE